MNRQEAISQLKYCTYDKIEQISKYDKEALDMAIEALKFLERYDSVWDEIKCAGEHGQEVEFHRYGRVYRIREVAT